MIFMKLEHLSGWSLEDKQNALQGQADHSSVVVITNRAVWPSFAMEPNSSGKKTVTLTASKITKNQGHTSIYFSY